MGVTQLWQVLAPVERHQSLAALEGLTLAVDLSIWVCETQCVKQMQGVVSKPFLRNLFFRISHLTQLGVKLVFVIEGSAPELKWEVMMQRQQTRYPGRQGKPASQRPLGKQTRRNFNACLKECCDLLDILGIPYVQSRGEAEAMCALLDAAGLVDGCLTNDGDAFLYGARTVYRNFTMNSKDPHVEMYCLSEIENQLEIDRAGLVALGLLLGCDFVPKGVPGIGVANATKLLQSLRGMDVLKRLQEWRKMCESQCVNQAEVLARRKAISTPDFPQLKVIQEFMVAKDRCPSSISPWKRPLLAKFQDFALVKLEWPQEYSLDKMLPLISLWDMQDVLDSSNPSTHQHLKPHRIVKTRVRQGIPCYEVEWDKPVTETSYDGAYYVTVESQELFARCYPHVVRLHEMATSEAGKKKRKTQGKKKKKNSEKAEDNISDALNNISFNFEKMNLGAVTSVMQQSVRKLPPSLPEYEAPQSELLTKIKAQKHYSAGHAVAPGGSSYMAELADSLGNTGATSPPALTVQHTSAPRSASVSSAGLDSPVFIKTVDVAATQLNDSEDENLLPFLERVKLRMQAKQSQASNSQKMTEAPVNPVVENSGKKSGKKKNKKRKGSQQGVQADCQQGVPNTAANTSSTQRATHSKISGKTKSVHRSTADLNDMNSLLEDIENLSLLRENAQQQTNNDAIRRASLLHSSTSCRGNEKATSQQTGPDRLKQRLSFSASTQKQVASPVTPFGTTRTSITSNFRKMSSPHCDDVCSPMSYIQNSGELSESFEIPDSTPGNIHRSTWSKKKAKKARQAARRASSLQGTPAASSASSAMKNNPNVAQHKMGTPADRQLGLTNMQHTNGTPANLSDVDLSAVKDFGDFKIEHSLLNSLCASLVQAITPKGISKEEYEKLCAALSQLEDEEEGGSSTAAQHWIEAEVGRSLQQVGAATAHAVSTNIHKSFLTAQSPATNTRHADEPSMQTAHTLNESSGIHLDSEEYKNLSKTARKKLRRKARQSLAPGVGYSPAAAAIGGGGDAGSCNTNTKPKHTHQTHNLAQSGKNTNSGTNTAKCKRATKESNGNNKSGPNKMGKNNENNPKCDSRNDAIRITSKLQPAPTQGTKPPVTGAGECSSCLAAARERLPSAAGNTIHVGHLAHSQAGQATTAARLHMPATGFFSQPDPRHSVNGETWDGASTHATPSSEDPPKKKKKKKKKKVKKADAITNLSADESMVGGLQQTLCSQYLRKAVEGLQGSSGAASAGIRKASPLMDLSADDTVLELDDLSSQLAGSGPSLDTKTKLKLARKRSSLEKMKASQEEPQNAPEGTDGEGATTSQHSNLQSAEPVLSLSKAISELNGGKNLTKDSTEMEQLEEKPSCDVVTDTIKVGNHMYETMQIARDNAGTESVDTGTNDEENQDDADSEKSDGTGSQEKLSGVDVPEVITVDGSSSGGDSISGHGDEAENSQYNGERGSIEDIQEENWELLGMKTSVASETAQVGEEVEDVAKDGAVSKPEDEETAAEMPDLRNRIGANIPLHNQSNHQMMKSHVNCNDVGSPMNEGPVLGGSEADGSEESFEVIVVSDEEGEDVHEAGSTRDGTGDDGTGDGCWKRRADHAALTNGAHHSLATCCEDKHDADLIIGQQAEVDAESMENGYMGPSKGLCDRPKCEEAILVKEGCMEKVNENGENSSETHENIENNKENFSKTLKNKEYHVNGESDKYCLKNRLSDKNMFENEVCDTNGKQGRIFDKNGWTNGTSGNTSLENAILDKHSLQTGVSDQTGLENGFSHKKCSENGETDTYNFSNGVSDLHNGINGVQNGVHDKNGVHDENDLHDTVCNSDTFVL